MRGRHRTLVSEVTVSLEAAQRGDREATERLIPVIYHELRRLAAGRLAQEAPGQTIQPTELVHEAYLRLIGAAPQTWENRGHFFAAAAEAMRRILIDRARRKRRLKRGGQFHRVDAAEIDLPCTLPSEDLLALNEALAQLADTDPQAAELVKLRFFAGLTQTQIAQIFGVSRRTADTIWAFAKAWLYRALRGKGRGSA